MKGKMMHGGTNEDLLAEDAW